MERITASYIIPVFNGEKHIVGAVESVMENVSGVKYEIIIVENGSTDGTWDVVKSLQNKYPETVIACQSDKGVSKARNKGMEIARGEYISFIDADDKLLANNYSLLYSVLDSENTDLGCFSCCIGNSERILTADSKAEHYSEITMRECLCRMISEPTRYLQVWAKIFRKEVIDRYSIRFNEKLKLSEDSDFTIRYLIHCKQVIIFPEKMYQYQLDNSSSVMRKYDGGKTAGYAFAMQQTAEAVKAFGDDIEKAFDIYVIKHFYIAMVREIFSLDYTISWSKRVRLLKDASKKAVFSRAFKKVPFSGCITPQMIPALLVKVHFYNLAGLAFRARALQNHRSETKR